MTIEPIMMGALFSGLCGFVTGYCIRVFAKPIPWKPIRQSEQLEQAAHSSLSEKQRVAYLTMLMQRGAARCDSYSEFVGLCPPPMVRSEKAELWSYSR